MSLSPCRRCGSAIVSCDAIPKTPGATCRATYRKENHE